MQIKKGKVPTALKIVIYGPEGIGKSTLASNFPDPLYIDTEGSTNSLDVARFDATDGWQDVLEQTRYVLDHPDVCKTLVIDTIDWAEKMETEWLCRKNGWRGVEDLGYGKGYTYSAEEMGKLLDMLSQIVKKGINVVLTAHSQLRRVELPDAMGGYDHWELKTSKKVAPLVKEWADIVLFVNYKTMLVSVDGKNKAQGGKRVMYTNHTPYYDAKNRFNLADELPLSYEAIRCVVEQTAEKPVDILRRMMREDGITEEQVRQAVSIKGHYPAETPISGYRDSFITGWVIKYWGNIKELINQNNQKIIEKGENKDA